MESNPDHRLFEYLDRAISARGDALTPPYNSALRLFSGYYEGFPDFVADIYARTLVLNCYLESPGEAKSLLNLVQVHIVERLPWIHCVVQKMRTARIPQLKTGMVTYGDHPDSEVSEHGVRYALDLMLNQDASLYLDTRNLRRWLIDHAAGWSVLNIFAYTGSLGVAALVGGADRVTQLDRSSRFMTLSRRSCTLNHLDWGRMTLRAAEFFSETARLKRSGELYDCVILDPPYFATTERGTIDLAGESERAINKVRPLLKDGGTLVAVNNALYLSGQDYIRLLERLGGDGCLSLETTIPVPPDFTGYPQTRVKPPPVDPAPFNHPTKIAVLKVKRK
jgi:23S rRNA (cytosine1962-C5)-methyltransferase